MPRRLLAIAVASGLLSIAACQRSPEGEGPAAKVGAGSIRGRVLFESTEAEDTVAKRSANHATAIFLEGVIDESWASPRRYGPEEPLAATLRGQGADEHGENGHPIWERDVLCVEYGDYIRMFYPRPGHYSGCWRFRSFEIFDPSGGDCFITRLTLEGRLERSAGGFHLKSRHSPWAPLEPRPEGEPGRPTQDRPPMQIQGWGRVEEIFDYQCQGVPPLYVVGVPNPHYTLVDLSSERRFRLDGIPAGTYWLRTFDIDLEAVRIEVRVEAGLEAEVEVRLLRRRSG